MKKTLIITMEFPPQVGGIATYVAHLAEALDPAETIVLAPWTKEQSADAISYRTIHKHFLFPKLLWPRWLRLFFHVRRVVKKEKIERILVHHALPVGYVAILIQKMYHVPYILFSHGTDIVAGTQTAWKKKMLRMVASKATSIIFNSESLKQRFLAFFPEFSDRSIVLYPCPHDQFLVPLEQERRGELRSRLALDGKKVMLSVGRLTDGKGFTHLARLLPEILKKVPDLVWLVVGDGPKRKALESAVEKNGLQGVVRLMGEVPYDELHDYYGIADFFSLLTHPDEGREEGLGLVFLEAAAMGLPVIAGRSGGVEEAVVSGETGVVVDIYHGDGGVVDAIALIAKNPALAQELGTNAQERVKSDFVWSHQVAKLYQWLG